MRWWIRTLLGLVFVVGLAEPGSAATDFATMQPAEIEALQRRLADDGCYGGPIDGRVNGAMVKGIKSCPDQSPVLRIETGMHVAPIKRIGVDAACQRLATSSDDKTVRLWALPEGRLLRTIRLPISGGNGGKIFAVALSPDGRTLAAGGWDAFYDTGRSHALYVVDLPSGQVRRLGRYSDVIVHLAFSADGRRVAIGLHSTQGIRVLDVQSGREVMADVRYGEAVYGLTFGPDGSLFTTSFDGFLRRYGPDLKLAVRKKAPHGPSPYSIALDPSGRRVAIGYSDTKSVSIVDAATLSIATLADTGRVPDGDLSKVAWTTDGRQLVAGGRARELFHGRWQAALRRFGPSGQPIGDDIGLANDTIADLKSCSDGIVFSAQDPLFGLVDADGRSRILQDQVTVDMTGKLGSGFTVSADGGRVRFGLDRGAGNPVLFDVAAGTLSGSAIPPDGLSPPLVQGLPITDWQDNEVPKFNRMPIRIGADEQARSLAIRPDRNSFVIGTSSRLIAIKAHGETQWDRPTPGISWGVNLARGGDLVVAAYGDGTIRWHRWSDGQELLALFVNAKDRRWVAWTPTGYYMGSPGAEDMIGWHVNRGWQQEADFFPASRFRDRFNRPDVVQTVLQTLDEAEAVRQANAKAKRRDDQTPILQHLPPVITILSPSDGTSVGPGLVDVRYRTRTPSGGKVDRIDTFVDGAKIEARGLGAAAPDDGSGTLTLAMPAHNAEISLVAYAGDQASDAARVQLRTSVAGGAGDGAAKPTLYALLVGVSHYEDADLNLGYAAKDASDLADVLKAQSGRLYADVQVKVLTDSAATSVALKDGLAWLAAHATDRDLELLFVAGHGITDAKGKFWFLTYDADPARVSSTAVSRDDITGVLYDLPGKKLMFLDACHSGAALEQAGARGLERSGADLNKALSDFSQTEGGVVAYAASTGRESSYEQEDWGHGAFTKALIEGFGGKADLLHKGTITTATLDAFLTDRVKELTSDRQHPVMNRPKTVPDFPIATVQ